MSEPSRAAILTGNIVQAYPGKSVYGIARDVDRMITIAEQLHRIAVNQCNGYSDEREEKRDALKQAKLRSTFLVGIVASFPGMEVKFGGDPRGCVVYIQIPGVEGDCWHREDGFGVYR